MDKELALEIARLIHNKQPKSPVGGMGLRNRFGSVGSRIDQLKAAEQSDEPEAHISDENGLELRLRPANEYREYTDGIRLLSGVSATWEIDGIEFTESVTASDVLLWTPATEKRVGLIEESVREAEKVITEPHWVND